MSHFNRRLNTAGQFLEPIVGHQSKKVFPTTLMYDMLHSHCVDTSLKIATIQVSL